jgi:AcrR family transcriptional regulator
LAFEKRRSREKENRKSAILKAARKLFFEKGFKSVTVESIAR